ncbi:putative structural protein [Pseudomonas phage BroderSalsa]|nr:putative structural protein [Pseudomonas phage BroderSalsa]
MATLDERAAAILAKREQGVTVDRPSLDDRAAEIMAKRGTSQGLLGEVAPVDPNSASSKLGAAVDRYQASLGGTVEALGEATGSQYLTDTGKQLRDENLAEAAKYGQPDQGMSYKDVNWEDLGSVGTFLKDIGIETAPSMAQVMGGAVAGQQVGGMAGGYGRAVGGTIGGFLGALGVNVGQVQNAIKEHDPDAKSPWHALGAGAAMSTLDAGGASLLLRPFVKNLGEDVVYNGLVKQGLAKEAALDLIKGATVESGIGAAQGAIQGVAAAKGAGKELDTDLIVEDMINNAIGGALLGGTVGGAASVAGNAMHNSRVEGSAKEIVPGTPDTDPQSVPGKIWSTMGGRSTDMLQGLGEASPTARQFIEDFNPDQSGQTATRKTIFEDADLLAGNWRTQVDEATAGLSKRELDSLMDEVSTPGKQLGERAQALRNTLDDVYNEAQARGLENIGYVEGHLPLRVDEGIVKKDKAAFIDTITPYYESKASATKVVDDWLAASGKDPETAPPIDRLVTENTTTGDLEIMQAQRKDKADPDTMKYRFGQGSTTPEFGHLEKSRAFGNVPQNVLNKFAKEQTGKERLEAVKDYFEGAAHRLAYVDRFGAKGEVANANIAKAVYEAQANGRPVPKIEIDRMYDLLDAYNGLKGRVKDRRIRTAQSTLGAALTIKTLPLATLSSLTEFMTPAIRGDVASAMRALIPTFGAIAHDAKRVLFKGVPRTEFAQVASEANITFDAATSVAAERLGANMLSRGASKVTRQFFILNGLSLITQVNRTYAAKTADIIIQRNLRALSSGLSVNSAKGRYYQNQLRSMGIDVQTNAQAVALYSPSSPSQTQAAWDARVLGIKRFVDQSVLEPNLATTPLWMNEGKFQLLAMLKRYPAAFGNTMLPAIARKFSPQYAGSNSRAAAGLVGASFVVGMILGLGYLQDMLKMVMKTGEVDYDDDRDERQVFQDVINTTLTPLQMGLVMDFFSAPRYGSDPVSSVAGPAAGAAKEGAMAAYRTIQSFADDPTSGYAVKFLWEQTPARFFRPAKEAINSEFGIGQ